MIGSNVAYLFRFQYEDIYYVSPALHELLHDNELADEVMIDIGVLYVNEIVEK